MSERKQRRVLGKIDSNIISPTKTSTGHDQSKMTRHKPHKNAVFVDPKRYMPSIRQFHDFPKENIPPKEAAAGSAHQNTSAKRSPLSELDITKMAGFVTVVNGTSTNTSRLTTAWDPRSQTAAELRSKPLPAYITPPRQKRQLPYLVDEGVARGFRVPPLKRPAFTIYADERPYSHKSASSCPVRYTDCDENKENYIT